jgi:hypothetical protein
VQFAHGETVTILRAGATTDYYGNVSTDWGAATETEVTGCALAPRKAEEERDQGRQGVIIGLTLYAPPGTDLLPTDRVRARGEVFEVDGFPGIWDNPLTGTSFGIEVALRRVEG